MITIPLLHKLSSVSSGTVLRVCLILSLVFHVLFVFAFRNAFSWYRPDADLRTFRVELIRPPVEDMEKDDLSDGEMEKVMEKETSTPNEGEETISLNTEDERYVTYARVIKESILRHWSYPVPARENLIEGRLLVLFSLNPGGNLIDINVLHGSGYEILDQEAQRAVRAASPFPPFPSHVNVARLNIKADFDYRIAGKR